MVDLFKLQPSTEHPHGLTDRDFDSLFTADKPIIFNFHGYPWLIHRLAYRRTNHENMHVRGYKEKGNINTPMELAINNEIDRFSLAIDVIDRSAETAEHRRPCQGEVPQPADRLPQLRVRARHRQAGSRRAGDGRFSFPFGARQSGSAISESLRSLILSVRAAETHLVFSLP